MMRRILVSGATVALLAAAMHGQQPAAAPVAPDPIKTLVGRLDLENYQINSKFAEQSKALAHVAQLANENYATDYPANIGPHMTNTDSGSFMDLVASVSLRENERGAQIGNGWDPHWHQPTDVFTTFSDKDFRLGLNAAQTTFATVAQLTGARIK